MCGVLNYAATTLLTFGVKIAALVLGTSTAIILARALGASARGDYALVTVIAQWVVAFANLGHGQAQVYLIGRDRELFPRAASNVILFTVVATGIVAAALWLLAAPLRDAFPIVHGGYLLAIGASVPAILFYTLLYELLRGRRAFALTSALTLVAYALQLGAVALFVGPLALGLPGAVLAWLLVYVLLALATAVAVWREGGLARPDLTLLRGSLRLGLLTYATSLLVIATTRAGVLLGALFLTSADVGVLVVGLTVAELVWYVADSAAFGLAPVVAGDSEAGGRLTPLVSRLVVTVAIALAVVAGGLADPLVLALFGPEYAASGTVLRWLLPGVAIYSIARILVSDLLGRGRPGLGLIGIAVGAGVSVLAGYLLIPAAGVVGAAWATSLAYAAATAIVLFGYLRLTRMPWTSLLIPRFADLQRVGRLARRFL